MKAPSWYASLDRFLDRFSVSGIQGDGETDCGEEYSRGHEFSRTHGEKLAGTSKRSKIAARTEVTNRTFARIDPDRNGNARILQNPRFDFLPHRRYSSRLRTISSVG